MLYSLISSLSLYGMPWIIFFNGRDAVRSMVAYPKRMVMYMADIGKRTFGFYRIIMVIQVIRYIGPF